MTGYRAVLPYWMLLRGASRRPLHYLGAVAAMLEKLGKVLHKTHNGYIVVELDGNGRLPPLNTPVYTRDARRLGVLLDIIGPINHPYAVVKPDRADVEVKGGEVLYYRKPAAKRRGRRGTGSRSKGGARPPKPRGRKR
jgi:RNA-binding protein